MVTFLVRLLQIYAYRGLLEICDIKCVLAKLFTSLIQNLREQLIRWEEAFWLLDLIHCRGPLVKKNILVAGSQ